MLYKLFINGEGDTGVSLEWAAQRLAEHYIKEGPHGKIRLRVIPEGGREREPSPDEIRTFIDHAAEIANETLVEEVA